MSIIHPDEVCDFCLSDHPEFVHESLIFFLPGDPAYQEMDGEWGACAQCHELILAEDLGALIGRLDAKARPADTTEWGRAYHDRVVRGFWDYRTRVWQRDP